MKAMKTIQIVLIILLTLIFATSTQAQNCKKFAKKECLPELMPYLHDGQFNVTTLAPGESAQMYMTFYSGQEYRILVCAEEVLGEKVILKIKDANRNVIFDNTTNDYLNWWTFSVKSSQQLIIEVTIPSLEVEGESEIVGCVSILLGFLNEEGGIEKK